MLNEPFARAAYMMFMITEVHPFEDGNGRVSRTMMNAEMISAGQQRIIIPSVYRQDYLLSLRRLSRSDDPVAFVNMLERAWLFTASVNFSDYQEAYKILESCNAFSEPTDGMLQLPLSK
jgi:Fic family protein